ncbi:MAG: hypothetical protein V3W02_06440 [Gammaproteobacteria bacterium]
MLVILSSMFLMRQRQLAINVGSVAKTGKGSGDLGHIWYRAEIK